jgi:hypothetical protein
VKQVGKRIYILLLYIDDILAIVDEVESKRLKEHLMTKYGTVQFEVGQKQSYLGMEIKITSVGMSIGIVSSDSPGMKEIFIMKEGLDLVKERERIYFHLTVAKLLYLAKRA